ncbi:MAG: DUF898 domain-containing protein [Gammaproteobacteria bacterium]|nr:DUF898 domain-containing protein [Gammaproteobacteria bacterium]MBU1656124.1 DUF898 domain-containing protein [Gammaproteobacteria bacterium]MBU1960518.1 DUF898 domain-containing protein [Gammaproteobacteria bacterium]
MSGKTYRLLFWGEIREGFDENVAWDELLRATKISRERFKGMQERGKVAVLCKGLSPRQAFDFQERFATAGIKTHLKADPEGIPVQSFKDEEAFLPTPPPQAPAAPSARPADNDQPREHNFRFTGEGGEYFRIWILNLLLTIITLGIYGPWAKVRNKGYLYGNSFLDEVSFRYLAKPLMLLKGRLIALGLFGAVLVVQRFDPIIGSTLLFLLMLAMPWAINRSLAFNARNSAYRNVRFDFRGGTGEAYAVFLLWPFLGSLTFGLLWPYAIYKQQQYRVANSRFGTTPFEFGNEALSYYKILGLGLLLAIAAFWVSSLLGNLFAPLGVLGFFLTLVLIGAFMTVQMTNLLFNSTNLADLYFSSDMETPAYTGIYVANTLLIILTLGLYYPWAKVRLLKYRASRLSLVGHSSLDQFLAGARDQVSATGQEIADVFDVDFGL